VKVALAFADTYRMLNNRISAFANLKMSGLDRLSHRESQGAAEKDCLARIEKTSE
jgi:hypothetical protein